MKSELKIAVNAMKVALHSAIDDTNFPPQHLSEMWRHYNGMLHIYEACPEDPDLTANFPSDYNFNLSSEYVDPGFGGYSQGAAQSVSFGSEGADVISFDNYT